MRDWRIIRHISINSVVYCDGSSCGRPSADVDNQAPLFTQVCMGRPGDAGTIREAPAFRRDSTCCLSFVNEAYEAYETWPLAYERPTSPQVAHARSATTMQSVARCPLCVAIVRKLARNGVSASCAVSATSRVCRARVAASMSPSACLSEKLSGVACVVVLSSDRLAPSPRSHPFRHRLSITCQMAFCHSDCGQHSPVPPVQPRAR